MKNIKRIILVLIMILIGLIIAIFVLVKNSPMEEREPTAENENVSNSTENSTSNATDTNTTNTTNTTNDSLLDDNMPQDTLVERNSYIAKSTNDYVFFSIDDYINTFFTYIKNHQDNEALNLLQDRNTTNIINISRNISKWYSQEMYQYEGERNFTYYIRGILVNGEETKFDEYYVKFTIDYTNETFDMLFLTNQEYQQTIQNTSQNFIQDREISKNDYNQYKENDLSVEEFCERYRNDFIFKLKYNVDLAYNLLDEENKRNQFNNDIEAFKQYVEQNKESLYTSNVQECQQEIENEFIVLSIKSENKIYQIKRTALMEYTVAIDE